MKKCECYFEEKRPVSQYGNFTSGYSRAAGLTTLAGYCNGTKERDECNCKGDRCKCDFYPEVRTRAKGEYNAKAKIVKDYNAKQYTLETLKWYLDIGEENGVVHIPKFMCEKMIEELKDI